VIRSFRHRGLKRLFEHGDPSKIRAEQVVRVTDVLGRLDTAVAVEDLNMPGYRLHRLKGELRGYWSVAISGNWRLVFRFESGHALDVDFIDYH
jgi:proteic killer suppression protein